MGEFSKHWPEFVVTALIAISGYLVRLDRAAMERRHERAENEFKEINHKLSTHDTEIALLQKRHK